MVRLKPITKEELLPLIELGFDGDAELPTYHIAPGTTKEMALSNFKNIETFEANGNMEYYAVTLNDHPIGFTVFMNDGVNPPILVSFAIHVLYRNEHMLKDWLGKLKSMHRFFVGLWSKNTRAIEFFKKNDFTIIREKTNFVLLWQ
jgi:predicted acetyltransferase